MLNLGVVSPVLEELYQKSKEVIAPLFTEIIKQNETLQIKANTNIAEEFFDSIVFVQSAVFKYFYSNRFVRFYNKGDIIHPSKYDIANVKIFSDFRGDVIIISEKAFLSVLSQNNELLKSFLEYQTIESQILHALCALNITEDLKFNTEIKEFSAESVIINEGDEPDALFEMLEGSAVVTVAGTPIGSIQEGEVFGEVSFLTNSPRGATVKARKRCLVVTISRPDFDKLAKVRPDLIFKVAATLAKRLTDVNSLLAKMSRST